MIAIRGERVYLGLTLAAICAALSVHADQPIVENYVGRQIPTAMVARNLDRGSGFWRPVLDTAPFPNRFLVEPPIYARLVAWVKAGISSGRDRLGWPPLATVWEVAGRWTSALMTTLGAAAFYGLIRRHDGAVGSLLALGAFGMMPVTLRFGRAFQPDATMLGFVLVGMAGWQAFQEGGRVASAWLGGVALATGLALKVTSAWVLLPFVLLVARWPLAVRLGVGVAMLLPAAAWYGSVWGAVGSGSVAGVGTPGSRASADNAAIWLQTLSPLGWSHLATWDAVGRNLCSRAFTPVGFGLAVGGFILVRPRPSPDRLWLGWLLGCGLAIVALGAKWHHGYYWLVLAPPAAVGVSRALVGLTRLGRWGRAGSAVLAVAFVGSCGVWSASTWRTPTEWTSIRAAGARIAAEVPPDALLIAPEAVLFYADRPGLRLEFSPDAVRRAAGEWGDPIPLDRANSGPLALVDFYRDHDAGDPTARIGRSRSMTLPSRLTARVVADVGSADRDPRRLRWRAALRGQPGVDVRLDEPNLILARLPPSVPRAEDRRAEPSPPRP